MRKKLRAATIFYVRLRLDSPTKSCLFLLCGPPLVFPSPRERCESIAPTSNSDSTRRKKPLTSVIQCYTIELCERNSSQCGSSQNKSRSWRESRFERTFLSLG